jgi:hypothetical protein
MVTRTDPMGIITIDRLGRNGVTTTIDRATAQP